MSTYKSLTLFLTEDKGEEKKMKKSFYRTTVNDEMQSKAAQCTV